MERWLILFPPLSKNPMERTAFASRGIREWVYCKARKSIENIETSLLGMKCLIDRINLTDFLLGNRASSFKDCLSGREDGFSVECAPIGMMSPQFWWKKRLRGTSYCIIIWLWRWGIRNGIFEYAQEYLPVVLKALEWSICQRVQ